MPAVISIYRTGNACKYIMRLLFYDDANVCVQNKGGYHCNNLHIYFAFIYLHNVFSDYIFCCDYAKQVGPFLKISNSKNFLGIY